jgi:hypothetical protein
MDEHFRPEPTDPSISRMKPLYCPQCQGMQDAVSPPTDTPGVIPRDGDWSICFDCAAANIFVIDSFGIRLRAATAEELAAMNPTARKVVEEITMFLLDPDSPKRH